MVDRQAVDNSSKNFSQASVLIVDESKCQGHGRCNLIAPEIFDLDVFGKAAPRIRVMDSTLRAQVLLAIANCPEFAINLIDGEVDQK